MDASRAAVATTRLDRLPVIPPEDGARPTESLSRPWAVVLGLGWVVVFAVSYAIEPEPAATGAVPGLFDALVAYAFLVGLVGTGVAAARRLPAAVTWSFLTGAVALGLTLACPSTGQHALGTWWYGQLAACVGMLGVTAAGARRTRR
jgi:peptidoglycan/LPS O-acetylase OafA/YrhL